jgi:hypothetical protein
LIINNDLANSKRLSAAPTTKISEWLSFPQILSMKDPIRRMAGLKLYCIPTPARKDFWATW